MKHIYTLGIYLYGLAICFVSLFSKKAKKWKTGRQNFWSKLPSIENKKNVIWFHAASLGEFEQGKPIIEAWKKDYPNDFILLTFFSPSGYEQKKNYDKADYICYLPLDTPQNAKRFIAHFKPKYTFFIKYEFWLNYIEQAFIKNSRVYAISAVFRPNQRFFKWYGGIFRKALNQFEHIFLQNEESLKLLTSIGLKNTSVAGDTRYDRAFDRLHQHQNAPRIESWLNGEKAFIIGSSWEEDEKLLLPLINQGVVTQKVIIAPHEINESHIAKICEKLAIPYQRYTSVAKNQSFETSTRVLILDCIGLLADVYQYGSYAYIGGAFKTGLHNILEPATFGLPVIFGPYHKKFPEGQEFINEGIGWSINNSTTLQETILTLNDKADRLSPKVKAFMNKKKGACMKIMLRVNH